MSGITLKIDKGKSPVFTEIMSLLQAFPGLKECKRHYSVRLTEEDIFRFRNELERIMQLLPHLSEKEWFDIGSPDKPGGLSIQLCKSEKKEFYIRYSS